MAAGAKTPLVWHMLTHHKGRLALSIAGIAFAVLMMFMQLGFLTGLFDGQTRVIRLLNSEILIANRIRHNINSDDFFSRRRLQQALDVAGVADAWPLHWNISLWKDPKTGLEHLIRIIAFNPDHPVYQIPAVIEAAPRLKERDAVLFDIASRDFFGQPAVGDIVELTRRKVRVVGLFELGADFKHDGTAIMSAESFSLHFPFAGPDDVSLGLVKLEPGADIAAVIESLREVLPDDVMVLSREDYARLERSFWAKMTPTGFIFGLGLVVGFVIGVMICYQILYNDVTDHLPQFATLKAIGYTDGYLVRLVFVEAVLLAFLGLAPALVASHGFYTVMRWLSGIGMQLTLFRVVLVSGLTLVMCILSGMIAVLRVLKADPAEVF